MIRNAIPFPFSSSEGVGDCNSSNILKSVLVDRQEKTKNNRKANNNPPILPLLVLLLTIHAINKDTNPERPPEASAVLAFMPIKITETIPLMIKNTP